MVLAEYLEARQLSLAAVGGLFSVTTIVAIVLMTFGGAVAVRVPRPPALAAAFALAGVAGVAVGTATGPLLLPAFALLGAGIGMIDLLVNLAGAELEGLTRRPVLQLIHAAYGAGGACAAVLAALATMAGWTPAAVLATVALAQGLAAVPAWTLTPRAAVAGDAAGGVALRVLRRRPDLQAAAAIVLCAFFIEGSLDAWSVLFVRSTLGGPVLGAAAAFAAFALAITTGRLFAARVLFRLGRQPTLLVSGIGSLAAGVLVVSATTPTVAGAAFLILGFFLSVAAPAVFGQVGAGRADAGLAVAAVAAIGYGGFVVGPPLMGWIGDRYGLRAALVALVVTPLCMLVATVVGGRVRQSTDPAITAAAEPRR